MKGIRLRKFVGFILVMGLCFGGYGVWGEAEGQKGQVGDVQKEKAKGEEKTEVKSQPRTVLKVRPVPIKPAVADRNESIRVISRPVDPATLSIRVKSRPIDREASSIRVRRGSGSSTMYKVESVGVEK